jgi:hypothetical protein
VVLKLNDGFGLLDGSLRQRSEIWTNEFGDPLDSIKYRRRSTLKQYAVMEHIAITLP